MMFDFVKRLLSDVRGSAIPLVAFSILAMVGATGAAVDMGRVHIVQSRLSSALDATGLAVGASASTVDVDAEANKYMNANFPDDYMGSELTVFTVEVSEDSRVITLHAEAEVDTTLMKIFGIDTVTAVADSEVTRESRGMELVLVMDVTGSMNSGGKLSAMKDAANDLLDILYGDSEELDDLWVGMVPFSQTVNIGSHRTGWVNDGGFDWATSEWKGCVDARHTGNDVTDAVPSVELFEQYYWPDDGNNDWYRWSWWSGWYYDIDSATQYSSSTTPNKYCLDEVTPLTKTKQTMVDAIDDLVAGGNTHVNLGAVWGWRMLSPSWRGLWGGEMDTDSLPLDYGTPLMNKVMILLTDGENTHGNSNHSAYWYLSDGRLGTTSSSAASDELDDRLESVCESMKGNGIIIYTIAFGSPGSDIEDLMESCASKPAYYFDSPSNADLQIAFQVIGDSLANLRISQ